MRPDPSKLPQGMLPGGLGGNVGPNGPMNPAMLTRMFETRDADGDGKLTGDEIPERLRDRVSNVDTNGDGSIQKSEMEAMLERIGNGGAGLRPGRGNDKDGRGVTPKRPPE